MYRTCVCVCVCTNDRLKEIEEKEERKRRGIVDICDLQIHCRVEIDYNGYLTRTLQHTHTHNIPDGLV